MITSLGVKTPRDITILLNRNSLRLLFIQNINCKSYKFQLYNISMNKMKEY